MEVHHHPRVERKNFKEYFLEFLMIFLAVTLGFFAENTREYLSDRGKEKEYVSSIKKNLIADTTNLNIWIPGLFQKVSDFDTLISLLQTEGFTSRGSDMYYYARLSTRARIFKANDNTLTELKNSGNFRLITNKIITNGLTDFQKNIDFYLTLSAIEIKEAEITYPLLGNLFDASVFNTMVNADFKAGAYSVDSASLAMYNLIKPPGNPQLRNYNKDNINLLIFYLHERKSSFIGEIRLLIEQKKNASSLIKLIDKEYQLENE
jgi:hypothetical protein